MWFDPYAKLAEIAGQSLAAVAAQAPQAQAVSQKSRLSQRSEAPQAQAVSQKSRLSQRSEAPARNPRPPARADGLDPDAGAYLDRLRLHGPMTQGVAARAFCWGATRAWRAEATLRAAGAVTFDGCGRAVAAKETRDV
jgi:hypothetical protein